LWRLRHRLTVRLGRTGVILSAFVAAGAGVGLATDSFLGFIAAYFGLLFVLPVALVLLSVGIFRGTGLPGWAAWIPVALAGVGVVTYGFHAFARELWDPADWVLFALFGLTWMAFGVASLQMVEEPRPQPELV
ncbi:MAG TPA: hypothetical protein VLI04_02160, partial [Nocardioidaceae bacterium]|nr:hypothetical protein [Nocardioidaceae bacterium]